MPSASMGKIEPALPGSLPSTRVAIFQLRRKMDLINFVSVVVLLSFVASTANAAFSKNTCHATLYKEQPSNCEQIGVPAGMCVACPLGPITFNGEFEDCTRTFDLSSAACLAKLTEYVDENTCDTPRVDALDKFLGNQGESEVEAGRNVLDFMIYSLCEAGCDCIPQIDADPANPQVSVERGNCQAHFNSDITKIYPEVRVVAPAGQFPAGSDTWPKVKPLLNDWINSPGAADWAVNPDVPVDDDVRRFIEKSVEATELLNPFVFQYCYDLETSQGRAEGIDDTMDFATAPPTIATVAVPITPFPTIEVPERQEFSLGYKVNCGGDSFTDNDGYLWSADLGFNRGKKLSLGGNIHNVYDEYLYSSVRWSPNKQPLIYTLPVMEGATSVFYIRLHFAEVWFLTEHSRVFDIYINDDLMIEDFDVLADAGGPNLASVKEFVVEGTANDAVVIKLVSKIENVMISAIEVWQQKESALVIPRKTPPVLPPGTAAWAVVETTGSLNPNHEGCFVGAANGKGYLIGGRDLVNVCEYTPSSRVWDCSRSMPPILIHHMQCVAIDNEIWIPTSWTGEFPYEDEVADMYIYNIVTDTWRTKPGLPPDRRRGATTAAYHKKNIYVTHGNIGGHGQHSTSLNWVDKYDLETEEWSQLPDAHFVRDHAGAAVVTGEWLCVAGGRDGGASNYLNEVVYPTECFDLINEEGWETRQAIPQGRAGSAVGTTCDNKLMIAGGEGFGKAWRNVEVFDGYFWTQYPSLKGARHGTGLAFSCECDQVHIATGSPIQGGGGVLTTETLFIGGEITDCPAVASPFPTPGPTAPPTLAITPEPTTASPVAAPTIGPTPAPTEPPTPEPTPPPTGSPTTTAKSPTLRPTPGPTRAPTEAPTTERPTETPTLAPTRLPTAAPTSGSTPPPTPMPTTAAPTAKPTPRPTASPTVNTIGEEDYISRYRVNAGGSNCIDSNGVEWMADFFYNTGKIYSYDPNYGSISNTNDSCLYEQVRWDKAGRKSLIYTFPVDGPDLPLMIHLHFAEIYFDSAGARLFDILIDGIEVLTGFDVWAEAGGKYKAIVKEFQITSTSDKVTVSFIHGGANNPFVSSIEVKQALPAYMTDP